MEYMNVRCLSDEAKDIIGALRLRPAASVESLATFTDISVYRCTELLIELARLGFVTCFEDHRWYALEGGHRVTESVLPALLNKLGKQP